MTEYGETRARPGRLFLVFVFSTLFANAGAAPSRLEQITLRFSPQEATGADRPTVTPEMMAREVRLLFGDGRSVSDTAIVGEGMTDDDERYPVRATNDVIEFARAVFENTSTSWGVVFSEESPLALDCKLLHFFVREADQAVGSMYAADVRLACSLTTADGVVLFRGTSSGDARRYGKSRNENNQNEVLSDAMKESYAHMLDQHALKEAWAGKTEAPVGAAEGMTMDELLQELVKLQDGGVGAALMTEYLNQQECGERMTAEHLVEWKQAGLPDEVIQTGLARCGKAPSE